MIRPLVFMLSWESAERAGCDLSVRRASRTSMTDACSGFHGTLFYSRKVEKATDLLVIWLVLALILFFEPAVSMRRQLPTLCAILYY